MRPWAGTTVLDPAGGTFTFPALAVENFTRKYGDGARDGIIREHILIFIPLNS